MVIKIVKEKCNNCGSCMDICPVGAIEDNGIIVINNTRCIKCRSCLGSCPCKAMC